MKRLFPFALLLLVTACSFAPIRINIQDVVLPAQSSGGDVCYVRSDESAPANFRRATYKADAVYEAEALIGSPGPVTFRVYGRVVAPVGKEGSDTFCTTADAGDTVLSDAITLEPNESKPIEIGGRDYGGELADLVSNPSYYLGAALEGGSVLNSGETITLTNGVVSVSF